MRTAGKEKVWLTETHDDRSGRAFWGVEPVNDALNAEPMS
jgi:hypothetical protein